MEVCEGVVTMPVQDITLVRAAKRSKQQETKKTLET
jgi:hypothetical protein